MASSATENTTLAEQVERIAADLVGTPYRHGGRDPATGLDCWGVVAEVCRRLGREVEDRAGYLPEWAALGENWLLRETAATWVRVEVPQPGDVAFMACEHGRADVDHAAVVLAGGRLLQATQSGRTCIVRSRVMARFVVEYRRRTSW